MFSQISKIQMMKKSTPGKLILIGEHAVVHGCPAISIPFHLLKVTATITPHEGPTSLSCDFYSGPLEQAPPFLQGLVACIQATMKTVGQDHDGILIHLNSTVPPGKGLGSSASAATATIRGLLQYYKYDVTEEEFISLIHISEKYAHGNPSGIDSATVASDTPVWFQKGEPIEYFQQNYPISLVIADSGENSNTKLAVSAVQKFLDHFPKKGQSCLQSLKKLTYEAREALISGDLEQLGSLLNRAHDKLETLGVSDSKLNKLVSVANHAGALGAKLTGGGKGGCMLALVRHPEQSITIANALMEAGATKTWQFTFGEQHS